MLRAQRKQKGKNDWRGWTAIYTHAALSRLSGVTLANVWEKRENRKEKKRK